MIGISIYMLNPFGISLKAGLVGFPTAYCLSNFLAEKDWNTRASAKMGG